MRFQSPSPTLRAARAARAPGVALLLAIGAMLAGGVAYARPCKQASADRSSAPPSVLIVMDASRSMAKPADGGRSRLESAKASLRRLIDGLPARARVGLRLYGHRVAGAGRAAGCRDTQLVSPIGPLDRPALKSAVDGYHAVGSTPIARALRAGAADLPAAGAATIVLVSDGGDNCAPPDPCRVAAAISRKRADLSIQTIGFHVSGRAGAQLRCIARHARGVYRNAANTEELAVALRALSARAMRTFRPAARPLAGGASARDATPIASGRFLDGVAPGTERWYSIALRRGQRLAATAVVISPCPVDHDIVDGIGTSLEFDVVDPADGTPLQRSGIANLFFGDESVEGTGLLTPVIGPQSGGFTSFARAGRYRLRLQLEDNGLDGLARAFGTGQLPLEVQTRVIGSATAPARPAIVAARRTRDSVSSALMVYVIVGLGCGALVALMATGSRRRRER